MSAQAPAQPPSARGGEADHGQNPGGSASDRPGADAGIARTRPRPTRRRPSPETVCRVLRDCLALADLISPADLARALQAATGASRATCFRAIADAITNGAIARPTPGGEEERR